MVEKAFFIVVLLYLLIMIIVTLKKKDFIRENGIIVRRILYLICFISIGIGYVTEHIKVDNVQVAGYMIFFSIVCDLAIFQTPSISKFAGAEFKGEELVLKSLEQNRREKSLMLKKEQMLLEMIQDTEQTIGRLEYVTSFDEYKTGYIKYVQDYLENFGLRVKLYRIDDDLSKTIYRIVCSRGIDDSSLDYEALVKKLIDGKVQPIEKNTYAVPVYGEAYNLIILISGEDSEVLSTDIVILRSLEQIFRWYMIG